jgi:hypothetical protein
VAISFDAATEGAAKPRLSGAEESNRKTFESGATLVIRPV